MGCFLWSSTGIYESWPKVKCQVNSFCGSWHKRFSKLYEAVNILWNIILKTQLANVEVEQTTVAQIDRISNEEVDKIVDK